MPRAEQPLTRLTQLYVPRWRGDGHTGDGMPGDCFRTALACLLGCDHPTRVPHFVRHTEDTWWEYCRRWVRLGEHPWGAGWDVGYWPRETWQNTNPWPFYDYPDYAPRYLLLDGWTPRQSPHVVVGDAITGKMVHDPHPSRAGLVNLRGVFALAEPYDPTPAEPRQLDA